MFTSHNQIALNKDIISTYWLDEGREINRKDIFLVAILLLFSGNPFLARYTWLNVIFAVVATIQLFRNKGNLPEYKPLIWYIVGVFLIFLFQTIFLGWNSLPAIINFGSKIIWGGAVYLYLGDKFRYAYLKVITIFAVISLVCLGLLYIGIVIPGLMWDKGTTILVYTYQVDYSTHAITLRNTGFPWEAGAFGCYLVITFILFINSPSELWHNYRKSSIIIIIALILTLSTTAYLTFFFLLVGAVLLHTKTLWKYFWLIILFFGSLYVYNELDFLSNKIEHQNNMAIASKGKFNSTRVGSLLFDFYYIKKHPLIGNGLHSKTRYADHQSLVILWSKGKEAYSGNGFSGMIASMGLLFVLLYMRIFVYNNHTLSKGDYVSVFTGIVLLLFGEPLMNYPLLMGFPLIQYPENDIEDDDME